MSSISCVSSLQLFKIGLVLPLGIIFVIRDISEVTAWGTPRRIFVNPPAEIDNILHPSVLIHAKKDYEYHGVP